MKRLNFVILLVFIVFFAGSFEKKVILNKKEKLKVEEIHKSFLAFISKLLDKEVRYEVLEKAPEKGRKGIDDIKIKYEQNKDNMKVCKDIYNDLNTINIYFQKISEFLNTQTDDAKIKAYYLNMYPFSDAYIKFASEIKHDIQDIMNEIHFNCIKWESEKFINLIKTKYKIELNEKYYTDSIIYEIPLFEDLVHDNIKQNIIYLVDERFEVLQSTNDGSLITLRSEFYPALKQFILFLETEDKLIDGYIFNKNIITISNGIYEYESLVGNKRVLKLKHINSDSLDYKFYFLFYK